METIPFIIKAGADIYSANKQAGANTKAAEIQAASDDKALAQAKEIYQQQRTDQGPYRESGYGAMDALNYGLGLPAVNRAAAAPPAAPVDPRIAQLPPNAIPALTQLAQRPPGEWGTGYLSKKSQEVLDKINQIKAETPGMTPSAPAAGGGLVKMRNPQTGMVHLIPGDQVSAAEQSGGVRI